MNLEHLLLLKGFPTDGAGPGFVICVGARHVCLHVALCCETLTTDRALEWPLTRVASLVHLNMDSKYYFTW